MSGSPSYPIGSTASLTGARHSAVTRAAALIGTWRRRMWERAQLARFSARDLKDIGLSPYDVSLELKKPFWRG